MRNAVSDRLISFIDSAQLSKDMEGLNEAFRKFLEPFGPTQWGAADLYFDRAAHMPELGRVFGRPPEGWVAHYRESDFVRFDPVALRAATAQHCFTWADARCTVQKTRRVLQIESEARSYGLVDGLVVPVQRSDDVNQIVSLGGLTLDDDPEVRQAIQIAARIYSDRGILLDAHVKGFFRRAPESVRIRLTGRERSCLEWAGRGKTDRDIAEILGISQTTATWHIRRATHKLSANSRLHAFAIAAAAGEVCLTNRTRAA